jgi:hypothetical protein
MPRPIRQSDMDAVFALTDTLGIHRESIVVPLGRRDPGGVRRLPNGVLEITVPETDPVEPWIDGALRAALADLGYEELP